MKTEYVRIYPEDELRRKVQRTLAKLRAMKQKIEETPDFNDIDVLTDMWIQYESTRYIVKESMIQNKYGQHILYFIAYVEDDFSDKLKYPDFLHNGLLSIQFLYESIASFLEQHRSIKERQYVDKYKLVLELGTNIFRHLDQSDEVEHDMFLQILAELNQHYLPGRIWEVVHYDNVQSNSLTQELKEAEAFTYLTKTLSLVQE